MVTVPEICKSIGRARLARCLSVRATAISNAEVAGKFPAKWFRVVADLCAEDGIECPVELFNFVPPQPSAAEGDVDRSLHLTTSGTNPTVSSTPEEDAA